MKKYLINIVLLFISLSLSAQLHNDVLNVQFSKFIYFTETIENEVILDVRTEEEQLTSGIKGAILAPNKKILLEIIKDIPKDTPILVYCLHSERSTIVCNILIDMDFEFVVNLKHGISKYQKEIDTFNLKNR